MQVTNFFCVFDIANKIANKVKLATNFFVFWFSAANKVVNKTKQDKNKVKRLRSGDSPCSVSWSPRQRRQKFAWCVWLARPLGTPRGRCDAHSGKFPSVRNQGLIEPVGVKKHVEGWWRRDVVRRNTRDSGANVEPAQHNQSTLPQRNSEVVNLTGLL